MFSIRLWLLRKHSRCRNMINGFHNSTVNNCSERQTILRPAHLKKAKVIQIWAGMTPRDVAGVTGISLDQIFLTLRKYRIDSKLGTLGDIKELVTKLQLRFSVVSSPQAESKEEPELDPDALIEEKRVAYGKDYRSRPPIVTIMGHVDHGKTTLLDQLRKSEITKGEFGGITQHIGAFVVSLDENATRRKQKIMPSENGVQYVTFLDTPGHAAFKSMRQRGANVTDIVILIIAADDGVMDQTEESIKYAQNANVPIIIAVNKIDKAVNLSESLKRIKFSLFSQGIILEEDGGETQLVKISALTGAGIQEVKDAIGALAETLDLKEPIDGGVTGSIIEVKIDPQLGKSATLLIQKGTLHKGDYLLAGNLTYCKVRTMQDEFSQNLDAVTPGIPVKITGWKDDTLPNVGENVFQFHDEKTMKEIVTLTKNLKNYEQAKIASELQKVKTEAGKVKLKQEIEEAEAEGIPGWLFKFRQRKKRVKTYVDDPAEPFKVRVLIKADVQGSAEVISGILQSYPNDAQLVKLLPLGQGVGSITEGDIEKASAFENSIIYSFNVPVSSKILNLAKEKNVKVRHFNVIYHLVDDLRREISSKMPEIELDDEVGRAIVQKEFIVIEAKKKVPIAGCRCTKGPITKNDVFYKVLREGKLVVDRLELDTMKFEKNEVKEIPTNSECGLKFKNLPEKFRFFSQDVLVCYNIKKVKPETKWRPPGF